MSKENKLETKQQTKKQVKRNTSNLWIVFNLVIFIALCLLGYMGYSQFQLTSKRIIALESAQTITEEQSHNIKAQLSENLNKAISQVDERFAQSEVSTQKIIANLSKQLAVTDRKVLLFAGRHRSDWLLAEADYLTRIANNRLIHERDPETALALLLSAEERIVLMDDPGLISIREALSKDIAALRLAKHDDVAAIAIRITGLLSQITGLSLQRFNLPEDIDQGPEASFDTSDKTWQQGLQDTIKELSVKWFDFKKHDQQVKPMMSDASELVVKNNMSLMLQTAQFATLKQHQELYINSIDQLLKWLDDYYDQDDSKVINFKQELTNLKAMTVFSDLPSVIESSVLINREVQARLVSVTPETLENNPDDVQ